MLNLSREEILELDDTFDVESFRHDLQYLLAHYIRELDVQPVKKLLSVGCDPNFNPYAQFPSGNYGFLHRLVHEYHNQNKLKGEDILKIAISLLESGADPDKPGSCNLTAIQQCRTDMSQPFRDILLKYGARPEGNTPV